MTCPICHRWASPDPNTGYDVDEPCSPECAAKLDDKDLEDQTPAKLLYQAAVLVTRALGQLDTRWHACAGCGAKRFTCVAHGHAYERLAELPAKLRTIAERLEADVAVHEGD